MGGVCLLFPPTTDPRSPHLSIASLAAFLRREGVAVHVRDLDVEGLHWILDPKRLSDAASTLATARANVADRETVTSLLDWAPRLHTSAPAALATLRDPIEFFDPDLHHQARAVIALGLRLVSAANGKVDYAIDNARYDIRGIDPSKLADLLRATADPRYDLFYDFVVDEVFPDLELHSPDIVGISILNRQQILPGLALARMVKRRGWFTVIGGTVFAKFAVELQTRATFFATFCHALVPYEGETALLELATLLCGGRGYGATVRDLSGLGVARIPNLLWRDHGDAVRVNRTHLEDVSALPTPDFDGLPLQLYLSPAPVLPILTGKGCYFNRCKFCDIPAINRISRKAYRIRPAERVAEDVHTLHERFDARHFVITDEALAPRFLDELASALDGCRHQFRFVGYARLERRFTPALFERLHGMGVRKLFFGLESGSPAVLEHMDKGIDLETARRTLRDCASAGIAVHVFSIVGFPEETEQQARETLQFLLDEYDTLAHPANTFDVHPFGLDLRTEYYYRSSDYGLVIGSAESARDFPISVRQWSNPRGLDADDVERLIAEFTDRLRDRYIGVRSYPEQQWPGFEEYAVLYADRYEHTPFRWRLALPDEGDPQEYKLMWASELRFDIAASHITIHTPRGAQAVSHAGVSALATACPAEPVQRLLTSIADRVPHRDEDTPGLLLDVRSLIDRLLAARAIWLRPAVEASP